MTNGIQKRPPEQLAGTFREPAAINSRMQEAAATMNLITPATSVGQLPEGCGIAMSMVVVNQEADCYPVGGGKFGLLKTALQRLAGGLGVSWDPVQSGRLDDGSHPYFCHWRAVGSYRAFDGQVQTIVAEKVLDMRDGSPQATGKSDRQISEIRAHMASHAESKAQLRAIRSLGIKTSYTKEELQRPFVCARIMFTGQTQDPELRREFARMTADAFLGGQRTLYGREPAPAPIAARQLPAPPPVGQTPYDPDEWDAAGGPAAPAATANPAPKAEQRREQLPPSTGGFAIPGGKSKGTALSEATDNDLQYWSKRIAGELDSGNARDPERDFALMTAMRAEISKRTGGSPDDGNGRDY